MTDTRVYTALTLFDRRGPRGQLRVAAVPWKGVHKAHIREYYLDDAGEYAPGRGIAFNLEHLDDVIYALGLLREDLEAGKLETKDGRPAEGC